MQQWLQPYLLLLQFGMTPDPPASSVVVSEDFRSVWVLRASVDSDDTRRAVWSHFTLCQK